MKNVLLYFVMFICVVFILLPPILRLTIEDDEEKKNVSESGVLVCKDAESVEMVRIVYSDTGVSMILYQHNSENPRIKDLYEGLNKCKSLNRDFDELGNAQSYVQLEDKPEELENIPEVYKQNYKEVDKLMHNYQFVCSYQKM